MKIFIDEAGSFARAPRKRWSVACVGAAVIPDRAYPDLETVIPRLRRRWGLGDVEIKGRNLSEEQARQLISLLAGYDILFVASAFDMACEGGAFIDLHRARQAEELTRRLTPEFHPNFVAEAMALRTAIEALPDNLYVQGTATSRLVYETLCAATLYYVQRHPEELGSFQWIIDAKDKQITPYESVWKTLILPAVQSMSFDKPMARLRGADYSHYRKFQETLERTPRHLLEPLGERGPTTYTSVNALLQRSVHFRDSAEVVGLQLADALTSITRRAMQGNLQFEGWGRLGSLMVSERDRNAVHLLTLTPNGAEIRRDRDAPYHRFIPYLDQTAKPMLSRRPRSASQPLP